MKALSAAYALVQTTSPVRMTPALALVASVVEVCGTASSRDFQVSVGQLVGGATQVLSVSAATQPEALAALFAVAAATLAAKHAFALGISDALVELAATRCRGAEVEPARSALAFIEALWSSEVGPAAPLLSPC